MDLVLQVRRLRVAVKELVQGATAALKPALSGLTQLAQGLSQALLVCMLLVLLMVLLVGVDPDHTGGGREHHRIVSKIGLGDDPFKTSKGLAFSFSFLSLALPPAVNTMGAAKGGQNKRGTTKKRLNQEEKGKECIQLQHILKLNNGSTYCVSKG